MLVYFIILLSVGFKGSFNIRRRRYPSVRNTAVKSR